MRESAVAEFDDERFCISIEVGERAERKRPLIGDMPNWYVRQAGHTASQRDFLEHLGQRALPVCRVIGYVGELSEHDARDTLERAAQPELREHAVDPEDRLIDVLQYQDRAVERWGVRGADERGDQGQVATNQPAVGATAVEHRGPFMLALEGVLSVTRHRGQECGAGERRDDFTRRVAVKSDEVGLATDRGVERRDIREANERFGMVAPRVIVESVEDPHGAVAAANAPDRIDRLIAGEPVEVGKPMLVESGEVALSLEYVLADHRLPAQRPHIRLGALEVARIVQRARWGNERHARARLQRGWKSHAATYAQESPRVNSGQGHGTRHGTKGDTRFAWLWYGQTGSLHLPERRSFWRVSLTTRVLIALAAGMGVGLLLSGIDPAYARPIIAAVEPIGTLFVNAIRMTVIPLVVSSLIAGVATSGSGASVARIGAKGIIVFLVLLVASGLVGALVAPVLLSHVHADPASLASAPTAAAGSGGSVIASSSAMQSPAQWVLSLVPANAFRAAVDGAMLPLIIFALVLGVALLHVEDEPRQRVVLIFRATTEAMLVIVRWLLVVAPLGVFALALPLVARLGLSAVGALATYVVLVSVTAAAFIILVLYPAGAWGGGISLRAFARAAAPAQAVAFSSRSSLAALPALIDSGRTRLHLPEEVTGFFLPLATAVFRVGAALGLTTGAVFLARLYGVPLGAGQLATIVATAVITSFSIPGIPGGSILAMVPVLTSVGLPVEGLGILLGVDTIPDSFRTTANVTGQLAAATIVSRGLDHTPPLTLSE